MKKPSQTLELEFELGWKKLLTQAGKSSAVIRRPVIKRESLLSPSDPPLTPLIPEERSEDEFTRDITRVLAMRALNAHSH